MAGLSVLQTAKLSRFMPIGKRASLRNAQPDDGQKKTDTMKKTILLLMAIASLTISLTACGSVDPERAALVAQAMQNFQTGINASMRNLNDSYQPYQPIPSAIPQTVPVYPPITLQPLRAY